MDNKSQKRSYGVKDQYCADFLCRVPTIEDMEKKWDIMQEIVAKYNR